jgi:regulator of sigma E protease
MSIILFLIILSILVFVHELGHFSVAKFFGVRVDEFGMGFPPRAKKLFSCNGTDYTLNWLPIGGFVKIYGEDSLPETDPDYGNSFVAKPWYAQILILIAGVVMNILLAWILFSVSHMSGTLSPVTVENINKIQNPQLYIVQTMPDSPAAVSGLKVGDVITTVITNKGTLRFENLNVETFLDAIQNSEGEITVYLQTRYMEEPPEIKITPQITQGVRKIGVMPQYLGLERVGFFSSFVRGAQTTWHTTVGTAQAFGKLIGDTVTGKGSTDALTGPVGLVGVVRDAQQMGWSFVINLAALISVNLAILNILPFPALDGGRVVIVLIEAITRKKINPNIVGWINTAGFFLLIALMVFITVKDVIKLF